MNQPDSMTLLGTLDKKRSEMEPLANTFSRLAQAAILLVVILSPWAFGSVYYWTQCLMAIGLMVALGIWWFETAMNSDKSQHIPYIAAFLVCGLAIALFQLVPLPAALSNWLLGRQLEIYASFSGEPPVSSRISLFPQGTWHQFQLLLMALGGALLASRYFRTNREMIVLLAVAAANGTLLAIAGMIQKLSSDNKIFWMYEYGHGPFASFINRNNGAGYLLMTLAACIGLLPIVLPIRVTSGPPPLISREMPYWRQLGQYFGFFLAELNPSKIVLLVCTIFTASAVIASASRGGSFAMLAGVVVTFITFGLARRPQNLSIVFLPIVILVLTLSAWVGFGDQLLKRWETTEMVDVTQMDERIKHWQETWPATHEMGLLGSGLGAYKHVHRLYSKTNERLIFEYAENQYFQALVEAGWPGLLLFLAAWFLAFRYAMLLLFRGQSTTTVGVGTMGIFLLSSQAIASLFDFGLYIPANLILMAVLTGLLGYQAQAFSARLKKTNWMRFRLPNRAIQVGLLLTFGGLVVSALNLYRHSKIDEAVRRDLRIAKRLNGDWDYQQLGMSQTTRQISEISSLLQNCRSIDGLNHLGDLWIHRFRLMSLEVLEKTPEYAATIALATDEKEKQSLKEDAWNLTRLERTRDYIQDLGYSFSQLRALAVTREPFIAENIPKAYHSFSLSRASAPVQPVVHLKLGQLNGIVSYSPEGSQGGEEIEHAIQLAPGNPQYRLLGGIFFVQARDVRSAAPHIKRFLEISPFELKMVMDILYARTELNSYAVPPKVVFETMLPDDPMVNLTFAKTYCKADPETRFRALERTESLLVKADIGEQNKLKLKSDVYLEKGQVNLAIETMEAILRGNPLEEGIRFQRASLLFSEKRLNDALEEAQTLVRSNRMHRGYNQLLKQIEAELLQQENNRSR